VALAAAVGRPDSYAGESRCCSSRRSRVSALIRRRSRLVQERIWSRGATGAVSIVAEMPVTPIGKIFKPKLREIAAAMRARIAGGRRSFQGRQCRGDHRSLGGLYLRVTAAPGQAAAAKQLLAAFSREGRDAGLILQHQSPL